MVREISEEYDKEKGRKRKERKKEGLVDNFIEVTREPTKPVDSRERAIKRANALRELQNPTPGGRELQRSIKETLKKIKLVEQQSTVQNSPHDPIEAISEKINEAFDAAGSKIQEKVETIAEQAVNGINQFPHKLSQPTKSAEPQQTAESPNQEKPIPDVYEALGGVVEDEQELSGQNDSINTDYMVFKGLEQENEREAFDEIIKSPEVLVEVDHPSEQDLTPAERGDIPPYDEEYFLSLDQIPEQHRKAFIEVLKNRWTVGGRQLQQDETPIQKKQEIAE